MQAALRDDVNPRGSAEALQVLNSREYGASAALFQLAKDIGLDRLLYSRSEPWVRSALAMIIGRLIYSESKLSLSQLKPRSTLSEVCVAGRSWLRAGRGIPRPRALQLEFKL